MIIPLVLLSLAAQEDYWPKLSARPLGFAAEFPVSPKRQTLNEKGPDDKEVKLTIYRAEAGGRTYLVTVSAFSAEYMKQPVETIFDNARNGSIARSGGKLVGEKKIKIGKQDGREVIVEAGKGAGFVRAWLCVAHGKQYAVMVAGKAKDDVTSGEAERFLRAFKITAKASEK